MIHEEYFNKISADADMNLLFTGREVCVSGKMCQGTRSHYLLHYVVDGSGSVGCVPGDAVRLARGGMFCYQPGMPLNYCADPGDPWTYVWVGFTGHRAKEFVDRCGFSRDHITVAPPFSFPLSRLFDLLRSVQTTKEHGFDLVSDGILIQILGTICALARTDTPRRERSTAESYSAAMKQFIDTNYQKAITVSHIVEYAGIDRSHAARVFRSVMGMSMQRYLILVRMENAKALLRQGRLPIRDVAHSVGYDDYSSFERRFRRETGSAPGEFLR